MITIENSRVYNIAGAVYAARNPLNSWAKSDSDIENDILGPNDLGLAQRLLMAGPDHSKFMRQIFVSCDITAPTYWVAEHDTYKVATTRNSCSFMHKGTSKPFDIRDFSVSDERVYEILSPLERKHYPLIYPYDTDEFRMYTVENTGRQYKVFRNGKVVRCAFEYVDSYGTGRHRIFDEAEVIPSETTGGYYAVNIGGRNGEKWQLHRLVAKVWLDNENNLETVNHIDGNKGNNSVENLEYMTLADNIKDGFANGLYENGKSLHCIYTRWRRMFKGASKDAGNENFALFKLCKTWEDTINDLNAVRQEYLDTKDETLFRELRQLLPSGYNVKYTWTADYAVLRNIYFARRNHRLPEWHDFCDWILSLPYAKELIAFEG